MEDGSTGEDDRVWAVGGDGDGVLECFGDDGVGSLALLKGEKRKEKDGISLRRIPFCSEVERHTLQSCLSKKKKKKRSE